MNIVASPGRTAWPHQKPVLEWAAGRSAPGFLMEMRLGKCLCAARWRKTVKDHPSGRNLVVCPTSVVETWQEELEAEGFECEILRAPFDNRIGTLVNSKRKWFITNYQALIVPGQRYDSGRVRVTPSPLAELPWYTVILDEADWISNPQAQTTKVCLQWLSAAPYRAILSGLLNPNSLLDFYCPMQFLLGANERFMGCTDWWQFRQVTHTPYGPYKWLPKPGMAEEIRSEVQRHCYMLTRKQAGVDKRKIFKRFYVDLPPKVKAGYDKLERHFELPDEWTKHVVAQRVGLSKITSGFPQDLPTLHHKAKLNQLMELIRKQGPLHGQRAVIWFKFRSAMKAVKRQLRANKFRVASIHGGTPPQKRHLRRKKLNDGKLDYLLVQVQTGRYGLNISGVDTAIYYDLPDGLRDWRQSQDRILHVGKNSDLLYVLLLARDTVDEDSIKSLSLRNCTTRMYNESQLESFLERIERKRKEVA